MLTMFSLIGIKTLVIETVSFCKHYIEKINFQLNKVKILNL